MGAFNQFFSRRECPAHLYSDNGTASFGAVNLLNKDKTRFLDDLKLQIVTKNAFQLVDWHFLKYLKWKQNPVERVYPSPDSKECVAETANGGQLSNSCCFLIMNNTNFRPSFARFLACIYRCRYRCIQLQMQIVFGASSIAEMPQIPSLEYFQTFEHRKGVRAENSIWNAYRSLI